MLFAKCKITILPPASEKGSEREQLFDGEATNGKPRLRTREEILATYRKVSKFVTSRLPYDPLPPPGTHMPVVIHFHKIEVFLRKS